MDVENQPIEKDWFAVGAAIRGRRKYLDDMTQLDLSKAAGVGIETVRAVEKGGGASRRRYILQRIEKALLWDKGMIDTIAVAKVSTLQEAEMLLLKRKQELIMDYVPGLRDFVESQL